jgi:hypothetical protein
MVRVLSGVGHDALKGQLPGFHLRSDSLVASSVRCRAAFDERPRTTCRLDFQILSAAVGPLEPNSRGFLDLEFQRSPGIRSHVNRNLRSRAAAGSDRVERPFAGPRFGPKARVPHSHSRRLSSMEVRKHSEERRPIPCRDLSRLHGFSLQTPEGNVSGTSPRSHSALLSKGSTARV